MNSRNIKIVLSAIIMNIVIVAMPLNAAATDYDIYNNEVTSDSVSAGNMAADIKSEFDRIVLTYENIGKMTDSEKDQLYWDIVILLDKVDNLSDVNKLKEMEEKLYYDLGYNKILTHNCIFEEEEESDLEVVNQDGNDKLAMAAAFYYPDSSSLPATRDESPYGSCWAHAAIALAELDGIKDGRWNNNVDLSELHLINYAYSRKSDFFGKNAGEGTYVFAPGGPLNYGGNRRKSAAVFENWIGVVQEVDVPYSSAETVIKNGLDDKKYAMNIDVSHIEKTIYFDIKANPEIAKDWILKHGGIGASYYANNILSSANPYLEVANAAYYCNDKTTTNHAVVIVGWDDNYSKDNFKEGNRPKNDGAWIVRNSWVNGAKFDKNNMTYTTYFWISYEDLSLQTSYGFDFSNSDNFDNIYSYDTLPNVIKRMSSSTKLKGANIFKAKDDEILKGIGVYVDSANTDVKVSVYTDITSFDNPERGKSHSDCIFTARLTTAGYNTIRFSDYNIKDIDIAKDSYFSVVVEYGYNLSGYSVLPYETRHDDSERYGDKEYLVINENESFYYNGTGWHDVFGDAQFGNVKIKAFTDDTEESKKHKEGWKQDSTGKWYQYSDGTYPKNCWTKIDDKWYHFSPSGYMETNKWIGCYWLLSNGEMAVSQWVDDDKYYVGADGAWVKGKYKEGWKQDSTGKWYLNEDGTYPKNTWKEIEKKWYHFSPSGYMETNKWIGCYWLLSNGEMAVSRWVDDDKYYVGADGAWVRGKQKAGWKQDSTGKWYLNEDGTYPKSTWKQIENKWYHFSPSGYMETNKWIGNYWLLENGEMAVSQWVDNNRYYVGADGAWVPGK